MKNLIDTFSNHRVLALLLMLAGVSVLAFVYIAQYGFNLLPCTLCLYQRKPWFLALFLAAAAWFVPRKSYPFLMLASLSLLAGAAIAGFHSGVEYGWWEGTSSCGDTSLPVGATLEELKAYIKNRPVVRCDVPAWTMFGISMSGYNFLVSLPLGLATAFLTVKARKKV